MGGAIKKPMPEAPSAWLSYIQVAKVDQATERAQKLGAKLVLSPTDIPNTGRFSIVTDPQGATVALFTGKS